MPGRQLRTFHEALPIFTSTVLANLYTKQLKPDTPTPPMSHIDEEVAATPCKLLLSVHRRRHQVARPSTDLVRLGSKP